eukprot:jgi/Mesen1/9741/ME000695S09050
MHALAVQCRGCYTAALIQQFSSHHSVNRLSSSRTEAKDSLVKACLGSPLVSRTSDSLSRTVRTRSGESLHEYHGAPRRIGRVSRRLVSVKASQSPLPAHDLPYMEGSSNGASLATFEAMLEATPPSPSSKRYEEEERIQNIEDKIERMIFDCRFLTLMAVFGSLCGSTLCFVKGCLFVVQSFTEFSHGIMQGIGTEKVILLLVEAVDVYLVGTVMLIFGMGLYELFVSALEVPADCAVAPGQSRAMCGSNFFGLFRLTERPQWLEIHSLDELKTKLGHVIVMILLVGMFEKSKKVPVKNGVDLLCFSASIFLASACLFLLSKLHSKNETGSSQGAQGAAASAH